jgi:O-acetyl-ADP-ribose deacetylase (regulator of RNase III)
MTVSFVAGDIFDSKAESIVNAVNCVGVMGKGIALRFKNKYKDNFHVYQQACADGTLIPGKVLVVPTGTQCNPKYIINFPTKKHWRGKSKIEYIRAGLDSLVSEMNRLSIESVAIPAIGCGHGGLDWRDVRPLIENVFVKFPGLSAVVFEPGGPK